MPALLFSPQRLGVPNLADIPRHPIIFHRPLNQGSTVMTDETYLDDLKTPTTGIDRRNLLKMTGAGVAALGTISIFDTMTAKAQDMSNGASNFYTSDRVTSQKVTFKTQHQTAVAGNLFLPKDMDQAAKNPAIIVGHPMGAVKEQSANLYATKMAEQGFVAMSIDLPFWGESEGQPRNVVSPEAYAEAFSAGVDFLGSQPFVDRQNIGAIGVCGSGSFVISAAKIDPRIKAVATVSMYDMGAAFRDALNKSQTVEQRKAFIATAAEQRWAEADGAGIQHIGGTTLELTADTDPIQREFYDFYRTPRGEFTPVGVTQETTTKPSLSSSVKFMNFYPFNDIETISPRPMLFISGDQAHSKEFSQKAYNKASEPKELVWVKGAGHVDLYDRVDLIPFDKLKGFFDQHLA
ncbi:alpha/beta hydrolase [Rhizobium sp. Leaf371]|uniref:alpha/beta hydrolase n=1 Tax=Rhizobium sp. Leaf371 TaxID=1736355 RepID=UPI001FCD795C|nr:alpha/beta hydrolase [Rhizobium sp. Leaf371]